MANMSQILTFDLNKKYPFEVTFPPEDFLEYMENPFPLDLRMADYMIKDKEEEVKVFCMFERLLGYEKFSKSSPTYTVLDTGDDSLLLTLFGIQEMIVSCVHCLGERR